MVEMKIFERSLQALLSSAPCSRVLARLTLLAQIRELARRLTYCGHGSSLFSPTEVPMALKLDCLLTILYSYKDRLLD